jgi:iron(III) transport system substrate-binding protein
MKHAGRKLISLLLALILVAGVAEGAFAYDEESLSGEIVIYSSMYPYVLEMMDEALKAEFPNLTPGNGDSFFVYGGSTSLVSTIYEDMKTGVLDCDMMLVAEPALALELKEAGYLEPVTVEDAASSLRFPYDEEGYWYPVRVCNMVLCYNPELEADWNAKGVNIPRTFHDFAYDPALKGLIAMGDPLFSGTTFAAVASLMQSDHYGRAYLQKLAANGIQVISGGSSLTALQNGEIAAAMILEESVLKKLKDAEDAGEPITNLKCIYPEDGVILIPSPVMTVAVDHSKHKNTAACKAVERWFLSEEAQELILKGFMHSVFSNMANIPYGSVKTEELIRKDMGVNWENAYRGRELINNAWTDLVLNSEQE